MERQMGGLRIKWCAMRQQCDDARAWISRLQQRSRFVVTRAACDLVGACLQVDDQAAAPQIAAIVFAQDGPASCRNHQRSALREFVQHGSLTASEALFALDFEDGCDRDTTARLDLAISVDEVEAECACEQASNGRLACTHHADQEQRSAVRFHGPKVTVVLLGKTKGRPWAAFCWRCAANEWQRRRA